MILKAIVLQRDGIPPASSKYCATSQRTGVLLRLFSNSCFYVLRYVEKSHANRLAGEMRMDLIAKACVEEFIRLST
jgi:hypothetical protein